MNPDIHAGALNSGSTDDLYAVHSRLICRDVPFSWLPPGAARDTLGEGEDQRFPVGTHHDYNLMPNIDKDHAVQQDIVSRISHRTFGQMLLRLFHSSSAWLVLVDF
jgi:hypothetical protein